MSNSGKVKCTCGWSWNKSDSSKKDMYVCHECGRDNSNNMKNGGWLDNYNDSETSVPEGYEGEGYSMKGRNYSPAWGGQFQMGGDVYPVNYVPQAQNGEDVVSWTKEYVKSPKYKERITNAGYNNPDEQIDRRLQNLENVNIVDTSNPRGTVYKPSKNTIETGYPEDLEYYNIHKNLYPTKPELNSIIAHELGHSETNRKGSATSLLNKRDREELKNRLRPGSDEDLEVYINGELKHDRSKHNIIPEENKSDLNSFRYDLRNMYDAGNEDFTEEYLKNSPDSFAKERLLKNYSPEDLIWLMNNVAQNKESNQQGNVAQMGASIPGAVGFSYARVGAPSKGPRRNQTDVTDASAQNGKEMKYYQEGLDFKPKSISKNGGWLDQYDVAQNGKKFDAKAFQDILNKKFPKFSKNKKDIDIKEIPQIVIESTGVGQNTKGKGEKTAEWVSSEIKKGNNIVKKRGDYVVTANNKILIPVNREGQQEQYVPYKQLAPGEKLDQEEINKIDAYKDSLDKEDLGILRRPLTYLESPEKLLGDFGIPGMETSEDDRLYFTQRDFHPDNLNMTLGDRMSNTFNYGLRKVPGAAVNVGLAMLGNPEAGALRITGEALNPLPMPLPGRGIKITPGEESSRFFKQLDNIDDTSDLLKPKVNPFQFKKIISENLNKLQESNIYKAVDEHVAGINLGLFNKGDTRSFFEKFPITNSQKAKVYAAQDQALQEGKQFIKDWHYGDDIDLHPDVVDKMQEIDPNFKLSIYDNTNLTNTIGEYANPISTTTDILASTRSNELFNENISDEAKRYILDNRNRIGGANFANTKESITLRNRGLYSYPPSTIKDVVIHEGGHTAQNLGTATHYGPDRKLVIKSTPFNNIRSYDPNYTDYSYPNPNTTEGKLFQEAMVETMPHMTDAQGKIIKKGYKWEASPAELHSELLPARSNLIDEYVKQGHNREEVMNMLRANSSDEQIDWMIQNKNLNRFFKETTSPELKRKIIRMLYAGVPIAIGAEALEQKKDGGVIKDDRGQWDHPGEITEISGDTMATNGYGDIPLYVVPDVGEPRIVQPNTGTQKFPGAKKFTEYPIAQNGFDAKAFQKVLDEKFSRSWRNKKDINIRETNPVKKDNINVKKKNEIIIPTKKENAARSIQDQKQYMKDYMDSPMYNEMVDNSTTGISDKFFLNLSRNHNYDTAKVTLMNRNLTGEDENVGANSNSTTGAIKVFPKGYHGPQLEGMISHEISHTVDKPVKWKDKARSIHEFLGNPYMDEKRIIPKKDINLMQSYYKGNDYYKELFNKNALNNAALNEDREWFNYVSDPTETRARLNDIRYNAKKYNIYDPFTEKVDVEKLNEIRKLSKKAGGFDPFNQLRDVYSEDQIINMLNTISQNDTEKDRSVSVAKNGIRQEQKGLQNLDQLTNFTNYNTKQPGGWLEKFAVGGIVPGGTTPDESYDIKEGDTLFEIARDNNVPLNTLANTNKLTNPDLIKTGDKLVIPKKYKKELSFNEIPTTDNKKIVIDNFSKHYDYIVEGDKTYYKVKSGNTWADISGNKEARANLLKFLDKNDYWKGYGSGEKAKFDKVNHEPVIVPGGKVPKTTPTVIRNTQTGNKPAIVKRPIAKVVKEEPGFFDEVSDFVSSGYESLQNKWKDVKEQTDLVKSVVEESVKLGVNTAIKTTEDAYHTLVNGIDRKFKTHTGEDNDVKVETKISQTPKTVKEWYGNTSGAEITQVIDAPNTDGRIYKQQVLPTSNIKFGVRNRGEYKDITTDGLEITTFNSFSKDPLPENTTVLAVDAGGNLHTGTYKDFKGQKDYLFSKTFKNNIIDFPEVNGKGQYVSGAKSGNPKYQQPKIKVLDDNGKVVDGSLNILVKDDSKKDYYGQVQGGRVLFVNPDTKQQYLVSGTINHIKQKFKELKGNSKYLEAYTLDNGTYSRGLSYKDKKLTKNRLKSYDLENTGGGNGLYIIDYKQPVSKYEEDYIDNMPNVRTKNDTSYKKGHALKNEVQNIVLHHTAYTGPNAEKELNKQYMTKGNNSSHIVIQENGKRTIYASPEQVTFHAGESEWNKRKDVNDFSIGVEFQGDTNKKPLTQAQIESFVEYYATIAKKYNLSLKDIITHQMIAPGRKPDINEKQYARILKYMRDKKFK